MLSRERSLEEDVNLLFCHAELNKFYEVIMDTSSKILLWGFSDDEKVRLDSFFKEISVQQGIVIEENQGHLTVNDILFSDKRAEDEFIADQKMLLFFNMPAEIIKKIMTETKKKGLPQPIYAMVTPENINWKFSDLVDHLRKEHEFIQNKLKERKDEKH